MVPAAVSGVPGAVLAPGGQPLMHYQAAPGQPPNPALRPPYAPPMPNGYTPMPAAVPQGTIPPAGGLFLLISPLIQID